MPNGTVQPRAHVLYLLVKLCICRSIFSDRFTLEKKHDRKKTKAKRRFQQVICFDCSFFDLEFSLKSFKTGPPVEILPMLYV